MSFASFNKIARSRTARYFDTPYPIYCSIRLVFYFLSLFLLPVSFTLSFIAYITKIFLISRKHLSTDFDMLIVNHKIGMENHEKAKMHYHPIECAYLLFFSLMKYSFSEAKRNPNHLIDMKFIL